MNDNNNGEIKKPNTSFEDDPFNRYPNIYEPFRRVIPMRDFVEPQLGYAGIVNDTPEPKRLSPELEARMNQLLYGMFIEHPEWFDLDGNIKLIVQDKVVPVNKKDKTEE